jgi:hypothetical protein
MGIADDGDFEFGEDRPTMPYCAHAKDKESEESPNCVLHSQQQLPIRLDVLFFKLLFLTKRNRFFFL